MRLFRRWILEGAKDDTPAEVEDIEGGDYPSYTVPPVISALAYSPDGDVLAVSGFREVLLYDAANLELKSRLVGKAHRIESLVYTTDGKTWVWQAVHLHSLVRYSYGIRHQINLSRRCVLVMIRSTGCPFHRTRNV